MPNKIYIEYPLPFWIPFKQNLTVFYPGTADLDIEISLLEKRGRLILENINDNFPYTFFSLTINDKKNTELQSNDLSERFFTHYFIFGLNIINDIINQLRQDHDILFIHNLVNTDLPNIISIEVNGIRYPYITNTHKMIGQNMPLINRAELELILSKAFSKKEEHENYQSFFYNAKSLFILGHYESAIINLEISFESMIAYFVKYTYLALENPKHSLSKILDLPLRHQIDHFLNKFLDKKFAYDRVVFKAWDKYIYKPRNKIVHEGEKVNIVIAKKALRTFIRVHNFLVSLAKSKNLNIKSSQLNIGKMSLRNYRINVNELLKGTSKNRL